MRIGGFILLCTLLLSVASCRTSTRETNQSIVPDSALSPNLVFIEDFYDFGTIKSGEIVSYTFRFTNAGNAPLIIKDIIPDCGCTTTKINKMICQPDEDGRIEVTFNSTGWYGSQYKSLTLRTNSQIRDKSVTIKANVVH